jgi:serine/threonine protein phosphatase PrpC
VKLNIGVRTDVGRMREVNEDSYLADGPLFGVADGMGGHVAGDVASQTAVKVITSNSAEHPPEGPEDLETYVHAANESVWEKARNDPRLKGMGTTCTIVFVDGSTAYFAHVGDSRAYLLRQGELSQVTEDHTLVQRMVNEGRLAPEEAAHHPQKNMITRALGVDSQVQVDLLTLELHAGDRILINSDGLSSMIDDEQISQVLRGADTVDEAAEQLVAAANEAGGEDNITVVVLDVEEDDPNAPLPRVSAQPRSQTPAPVVDEDRESVEPTTSSGLFKKLAIALVLVVVLAGVAFGATRYALAHSWFVGASSSGTIAIYKGIPDDIAGMTLKEEVRNSDMKVEDLPPSFQTDVEEGVKKESLEEAEKTLDNYRELIKNFKDAGSGDGGSNKGDGKN